MLLNNVSLKLRSILIKQYIIKRTREANGEPNIITVATEARRPARKTAASRFGTKY